MKALLIRLSHRLNSPLLSPIALAFSSGQPDLSVSTLVYFALPSQHGSVALTTLSATLRLTTYLIAMVFDSQLTPRSERLLAPVLMFPPVASFVVETRSVLRLLFVVWSCRLTRKHHPVDYALLAQSFPRFSAPLSFRSFAVLFPCFLCGLYRVKDAYTGRFDPSDFL